MRDAVTGPDRLLSMYVPADTQPLRAPSKDSAELRFCVSIRSRPYYPAHRTQGHLHPDPAGLLTLTLTAYAPSNLLATLHSSPQDCACRSYFPPISQRCPKPLAASQSGIAGNVPGEQSDQDASPYIHRNQSPIVIEIKVRSEFAPFATHRRALLLHRPPLLFLHALAAALADPQRHLAQQRLRQRRHGVCQLAPGGFPQQRLRERRDGVGQLGAVAREPVGQARAPVLKLPMAQQAARVHRLWDRKELGQDVRSHLICFSLDYRV